MNFDDWMEKQGEVGKDTKDIWPDINHPEKIRKDMDDAITKSPPDAESKLIDLTETYQAYQLRAEKYIKELKPNTRVYRDLIIFNSDHPEGSRWKYPCNVCGRVCEIYCVPVEFDPKRHHCCGVCHQEGRDSA